MDIALNFSVIVQMLAKDRYVEFEDGREVCDRERCHVRHLLHCGALRARWRAPISNLAVCRAH